MNASVLCVDRHLSTAAAKPALVWENEREHYIVWTYQDLYERVTILANTLASDLHVGHNDRIAVYMPTVAEMIAGMLACWRVGANFTVIPIQSDSGLLRQRLLAEPYKVLLCADITWSGGKSRDLQALVWRAIDRVRSIEVAMIYRRTILDALPPRLVDWRELSRKHRPIFEPVASSSDRRLGQSLEQAGIEFLQYFDTGGVHWGTAALDRADRLVHSVLGPLYNGATCFIFEGSIDALSDDRLEALIAGNNISSVYAATEVLARRITRLAPSVTIAGPL